MGIPVRIPPAEPEDQEQSRIFFPGNPWPAGHAVADLTVELTLDDTGLYLDLELATAEYSSDDTHLGEHDLDGASDWQSKTVWNNYHACSISTNTPVPIPTPFHCPPSHRTSITLPDTTDADEPSFSIYLLGHDSIRNNTFRFYLSPSDRLNIDWTADIALTYSGDNEFKYTMDAKLKEVDVDGIAVTLSGGGSRERRVRELATNFLGGVEDLRYQRGEGDVDRLCWG